MITRRNIITNFMWRFLENGGVRAITFVLQLVLARILVPSDYGKIALIAMWIDVLQIFIDGGMASALIQGKEVDEIDFSSALYFNIITCLTMYLLIFISAPLISNFYNIPDLTLPIRVMGLLLIISGVKNVQYAYVSRNMQFRKFFFSTLSGTLIGAFLGIYLAYNGFGFWALIFYFLLNNFIDTIILWFTVGWRPKWIFSFSRIKNLFSYGWKLLVSGLIDTTFHYLRQFVIGKFYTTEDLAYYNKGNSFPALISENINYSLDSVLFPTMSNVQSNVAHVRAIVKRAITINTYIMAPLMIGLSVCAEPLVRILLTEKWLPCVFFIRIFCLVQLSSPIRSANVNAIKSMGRSGLYLKLEIIKFLVNILVVLLTFEYGVKVIAIGHLFIIIFNQTMNAYPNKKLIQYSHLEQIKDIGGSLFLALFMGFCIYPFTFLKISDIFILLLQIITGVFIYYLGSKIFKLEPYEYIKNIIAPHISRDNIIHRFL